MPLLMCTTVPPAKSSAPSPTAPKNPPCPHTQCANGQYTSVLQSTINTMYVENFIRSAIAPLMRAGVMIANIIWKSMKVSCGTVGA